MRTNILRSRIRLHVFGYIIQRACRKAEDDRRKGKASDAAPETEDPTPPTSFMDAVRVGNSRRIRSMSPSPDTSADELARFSPTGDSNSSKSKEYPNVPASKIRSLRNPSSTQQDMSQIRTTHGVSVVIPAKKRVGTGITALENSKCKQSRSQIGSNPGKASESSVKDRTSLMENCMDAQFLHDRRELGFQLLDLFKSQNPGRQEVAEMQKVVEHIGMMVVKYREELRKGLESSMYEKYKGALKKWLACMRTLVEYREATGLSGDGQAILTGFKALPVEKKKAGRPYFMKFEEIRTLGECDSTTLPVFCEEVGSMLLKMASFPTLGMESELGMELDELLLGLIPFTTRLMECLLATPSNP